MIQIIRAGLSSKFMKLAKLLAITAVIVFGLYSLFFSNYFSVTEISIESTNENQTIIGGNIVNDLKEYKGKNILFINKQEIQAKVQKKYPEIDSVQVSTDWPKTIVISFSEFPIVANLTNISKESTKKYIINSVGYVIQKDTDNTSFPYIKIKTDAPLNPESALIDKNKLEYILGSAKYFTEKFGMKIVEIEYMPIPREVHLRTEKFFYIWLDIQKPYEDQLKKLKKALVKIDIYNELLEYIDLRITGESGEKIIYKRRK